MKVVRSTLERKRITSGSSCPSEERVLVVRGSAEDDAGGRSGWLVPCPQVGLQHHVGQECWD